MNFVMYADCDVIYDGRGYSTLDRGNYLIIYKADKSLSVYAATKVLPRNYMSEGAVLTISEAKIEARRKSEIITINLHQIFWRHDMVGWSSNQVVMQKTEAQLVDKFRAQVHTYYDKIVHVVAEYQTPVGPVDLLVETETEQHVLEFKRKSITLSNYYQLKRYIDIWKSNKTVIPTLVGPSISKKALEYLEMNNGRYIQFSH